MQRQQSRQGRDERAQQRPPEIYPLPRDSRAVAEAQAGQCFNYGLRVERLLTWDAEKWELTRQAKERFAKQAAGRKVLVFTHPEHRRLISAHRQRWEKMLEACEQCGYQVRRFTMCAAERIVVGLGAESVLETNIRLHRIYGFPIIPGSALKGLARSYALWQAAEQLGVPALSLEERSARDKTGARSPIQKLEAYLDEPAEDRRAPLLDELKRDMAIPPGSSLHQWSLAAVEEITKPLRLAFGTIGSAGKVIFFDAVPTDPAKLKLDLDVMTPHYSDYYMKKLERGQPIPPADYLNPNPVPFLTVAPGSEFLFAVTCGSKSPSNQERLALVDIAVNWLRAGLADIGAGAKTVAGYGLWR